MQVILQKYLYTLFSYTYVYCVYKMRKKLTITIEENILNKFKEYCEEEAINISKKIEKYIKKDIEKWQAIGQKKK